MVCHISIARRASCINIAARGIANRAGYSSDDRDTGCADSTPRTVDVAT